MSAQSATLAGRRAAESLMVDSCTVTRPVVGEPDPMTGADTVTYTLVYSGKCEVKAQASLLARDAESAGSVVTVQTLTHKTPADSPAFLPGDLIEMDADTFTPRLRGVRLSVDGAHVGTWTTAQRVPVTYLSGVS